MGEEEEEVGGRGGRNGAQQSRVRAVEMSYLRGACGVNRWDGLSKESVYERCGMRGCGCVVGCGMVWWNG